MPSPPAVAGTASPSYRWSLLAVLLTTLWTTSAAADDWPYVVQPGDTLQSIARDLLRNWRDWNALGLRNALADNDRVRPGSTLYVPVALLARRLAYARVLASSGPSTLETASGDAVPVKIGMRLAAGDRLTTAAGGFALIEFDDGSRLELAENSAVVLVAMSRIGRKPYNNVEIRLESGRGEVEANPGKAPNTRIEMHTPAASTSVRGTSFRLAAADTATRAEVTEGAVHLANAVSPVRLDGGFGTIAAADRPPLSPRNLLPAPALTELPARVDHLPSGFDFAPVPAATGYRVRLRDGESPGRLLRDELLKAPPWPVPVDLANGRYRILIRAIDGLGLEGFDARHTFEVGAHPRPPRPVSPEDGAVIHGNAVTLSWRSPSTLARVQLSPDPAFRAPITLQTRDDGIVLGDLEPGKWHWRLASVGADGAQGPAAPGGSFSLRPIPPPPTAITATNDPQLTVAWRGHPGDAAWRVQVARDPEFEDVFVDRVLTEPRYQQRRLFFGRYYLRLNAVDAHGYEGPFSAPVGVRR